MSGAVALGQVSDGALERKARLARVCSGVRDAHDHGDHLFDVAARRCHLRKRAGHLVKAVAGLVRVPHQLVQVAVHLIDALASGVHDGLHVRGLLCILIPSAGDLIQRQTLHKLLAGIHGLVGNVHQYRDGHNIQSRKLLLQGVQRTVHGGKVHLLRSCIQLLKALFGPFELQFLHHPVDGVHGLFCVFLKVRIVELQFYNTLVYFTAHSVFTSPHARSAILSKTGRIAGFM